MQILKVHREERNQHNMKHLAAYLLLVLGGNDSPTAKDIKNVLDSVGIEADDDRIKKLLGEVKGKDLNDVCHFPFPPPPPSPWAISLFSNWRIFIRVS